MPHKRIRTRGDVQTKAAYNSYWFNGTHYVHNFHEFVPTGSNYELIHDYVSTVQERKIPARYRPHPLVHLKVRQDAPATWFNNASNGNPIDNSEYPISFNVEGIRALLPETSSAIVSDLGLKAYNALVSQVPEQVSIANFAWELREWKALAPTFSKDLKKSVSGNFLKFEFGIKPLIGDLKKLYTLADTVSRRLEYLRKTVGKEVRVSFHTEFDLDGPSYVDSPSAYNYYSLRYVRSGSRGIFNVSGYLTQRLKGLDDTEAMMKAYLAALGLNNPAAIVWEAIPYSFVVDWVANVGGRLERLAIQPFEGEWNIKGLTTSYNEQLDFRIFQSTDWDAPNGRHDQLVGTGSINRFSRGISIPAPSSILTTTSLDPRKQLLSLALLHQRM